MGKQKKPFIDPANAAHFHLVHRSQRDPRAADPEAPQRVLAPLPETGNQARKSVRGTQSTRAILQEQDLDGFDEAVDDPAEAAAIREAEAFNELGLPTGYNYEQHLRPIGQAPGAHFIPAPRSVASMACSRLSQGTRATGRTSASARSRRGELVLREEVGGEAFASVDELNVGVSGMTEVDREAEAEAVEEAKEALGDDVWEALQGDWEDGDDPGMDDDFVLRLETGVIRETEMLRAPARKPKGGKTHATAAAEGEEEHEEEEEETEEGRYDDAEDDEEEEGAVAAGGAAAAAKAPQGGGERRPNPFAELFGSLDDDDEDEDEDDEDDEDAGWGALATGGGGAGRLGAANAAAAARPTRLLDEQFARLMAEYDEEEIGELDEDDPTVQGAASIEAYEHVLEDFLHSSALHKIKPALAAKMQPHDFGAPTREQVDGAPEAGAGAEAEAEAERERRLMAQSAGLERVESGALRCKGLKPGVLLPNRGLVGYRPGLGGDGEAGEAEGEGAAEGGAAEAEADEEGLPEDPRAAETAVSIDDHPFLAGLKEGPKKVEWDAETILSTYSTTDNHPSLIRVPRKPKSTSSSAGGNQGPSLVQLDKRTGLPVGITLPGAKPRLAATAEVAEEEGGEEDEDEDEGEDGAANAGAARKRGESAEEKRQRKQQAKEQKQARRHEKKTTKLAFTAEKSKQLETHARTKQLPACPL